MIDSSPSKLYIQKKVMGLFDVTYVYDNAADYIDSAAKGLISGMKDKGCDVCGDRLAGGSWDISIKKGNAFKYVLGWQTALKVTLTKVGNDAHVKMGIGFFGQHIVPGVIAVYLACWPLIACQIWGMVKELKFENDAHDILTVMFVMSAMENGSNCDIQRD